MSCLPCSFVLVLMRGGGDCASRGLNERGCLEIRASGQQYSSSCMLLRSGSGESSCSACSWVPSAPGPPLVPLQPEVSVNFRNSRDASAPRLRIQGNGCEHKRTNVGPLSFSKTVVLGASELILLFGRVYDETEEAPMGEDGVLILGGQKLVTMLILSSVIVVCL